MKDIFIIFELIYYISKYFFIYIKFELLKKRLFRKILNKVIRYKIKVFL